MDMFYIMDSGQNRLYTTFPNVSSLISADPADLSRNQKNNFPKTKMTEIWFNRDSTLVPSPHQHSLQTHKFDFWILEYKIFT